MKSPVTVFIEGLQILAFMLPWLNPFAPGPTPAVVPWLIAVGVTGGLILLESLRTAPRQQPGKASFGEGWAFPMACACALAGLISSVMGLMQYFGVSTMLEPWVAGTAPGEAFANLRQRNQFASLTNLSLAALVWLAATDRGAPHRKWLVLLGAALLAVGNAASSSRTGLLQLFLLCMLCGVWGTWRQPLARRVLLVAVLIYALALLALPWLAGFELQGQGALARLRDGDAGCGSRITLWSNVLHLIAQKPWLGWGWGELDYAHYMTLYPDKRFCYLLDNAHNLPLHLAVELGIPIAMLVCSLTAWLVLRARPWGESDPTRQLAWSLLALITLHSLLEYPLWYGPFQMALGVSVYLLCTPRERRAPAWGSQSGVDTKRVRANYLLAATAALMMAVAASAAWEYHRVRQIYLEPAQREAAYRENTLEKIRDTYLFRHQFDFAAVSLTPLTPANALQIYTLSSELLHYSPEPRVIEKVIESAVMLRRGDDALLHLARYRAAFPADHAQWRQTLIMPNRPAN
ncbi:MAG: Wzy polymerase domain-containing protein [Pseudomonadota bacterium]